ILAGQGEMVIVLTRCVAGSSGLGGLGMFVADREGGNYQVERAEHKFTIRASPTCALVFAGTRSALFGKAGDGWKQIVTFMNESRLGVGIQGIGVATAALEKAAEYAARRVQIFFFSSRRRHTRWPRDWSSDVCSSDLRRTLRWR